MLSFGSSASPCATAFDEDQRQPDHRGHCDAVPAGTSRTAFPQAGSEVVGVKRALAAPIQTRSRPSYAVEDHSDLLCNGDFGFVGADALRTEPMDHLIEAGNEYVQEPYLSVGVPHFIGFGPPRVSMITESVSTKITLRRGPLFPAPIDRKTAGASAWRDSPLFRPA